MASARSRSSQSVSPSSASGVGPRSEALLTSTSSPPSSPSDLHGDGVDVRFHGDVADDAVRAGVFPRHPLDAVRRAGDERHARAATEQLPDEGQTQPGGAAGDRDPQAVETIG